MLIFWNFIWVKVIYLWKIIASYSRIVFCFFINYYKAIAFVKLLLLLLLNLPNTKQSMIYSMCLTFILDIYSQPLPRELILRKHFSCRSLCFDQCDTWVISTLQIYARNFDWYINCWRSELFLKWILTILLREKVSAWLIRKYLT